MRGNPRAPVPEVDGGALNFVVLAPPTCCTVFKSLTRLPKKKRGFALAADRLDASSGHSVVRSSVSAPKRSFVAKSSARARTEP